MINSSPTPDINGVMFPASWHSLYAVIAILVAVTSGLAWAAWNHRPPPTTLRVTPGYHDAAPRFHGQRCDTGCSQKVDGYAWAMLGDIRDESICRRHLGEFREGCVTYVKDHAPQRSWYLKR